MKKMTYTNLLTLGALASILALSAQASETSILTLKNGIKTAITKDNVNKFSDYVFGDVANQLEVRKQNPGLPCYTGEIQEAYSIWTNGLDYAGDESCNKEQVTTDKSGSPVITESGCHEESNGPFYGISVSKCNESKEIL